MSIRQKRTNLSYTFSGLTPGVSVILVDSLWKYEANNIWKAAPKRVGTVKDDGSIQFTGLRDSIYALLIVDFDHIDESRFGVQIGNPKDFQTISYHVVPSAVNIYSATAGVDGDTCYVDLIWHLPTNGVDGFYHIYYKSSSSNWNEWKEIVNPDVFGVRITPLQYNTSYSFRIKAYNEDGRGGAYSSIVIVSTAAKPKIDTQPPTNAAWIT